MRFPTHRTLTIAAACSALLVGGCSSDGPAPQPTDAATSAAPSSTTSAWESKYTPEQITAYDAALARWTEYEQRSAPIWADGKVTPAARDVFRQYWLIPALPEGKLQFNGDVGDKVIGLPTVSWSRPSDVKVGKGTAEVTLEQCIDPSTIRVEHARGAKVEERERGPYIRRIFLARPAKKGFVITSVLDITSGKKVTSCEP